MVRAVGSNVLSRVAIVTVPSLFAGVQSTRVGIALRAKVEDGIDSGRGATVTETNHNTVLVGTDDGSKLVQHNVLVWLVG